jgi:hypothetical protein
MDSTRLTCIALAVVIGLVLFLRRRSHKTE